MPVYTQRSQVTEAFNIGLDRAFIRQLIEDTLIGEQCHEYMQEHGSDEGFTPSVVSDGDIDLVEEGLYQSEAQSQEAIIDAGSVRKLLSDKLATVPAEEIENYYSMFPAWRPGEPVEAGDKRQHKGKLYEVIENKDHTTQVDWPPDITPSLWKRAFVPEEIPVWFQPTGAHDAWHIGDAVYYPDANGEIWDCTQADANGNNVWEPGVYGWVKRV
jgi:hypothetical protein